MDKYKVVDINKIGITCCNCLKEGNIKHIKIPPLRYGSFFDNMGTQIDLCDDCHSKTNPNWWEFEIIGDDYDSHYKYEDDLIRYLESMPLNGQELVFSYYSEGALSEGIPRQDWIDYELGVLSHEKCKEYGVYSRQEIQAYKDRFPTCREVFIKIWSDGSSGSRCRIGASGKSDGSCGLNISKECFVCDIYQEKEESFKVKTINELEEFYRNEKERLNYMIKYATDRLLLISENKLNPEE